MKVLIALIICLYGIVAIGCNHRRLEMRINYTMDGCFGSDVSELTIYSTQDSTIAILKTKGQQTKQVKLIAAQHPAMASFLYEFKQIPDKNCFSTTTENYAITYFNGSEYINLSKKYNCLVWDGFKRLKNVLFNFQP